MISCKRSVLFLIFLTFTVTVSYSLDIIYLTTGDKIEAKILDVSTGEVTYKKAENIEGPSYNLNSKNIIKIVYENGSVDYFSETESIEDYSYTDKFSLAINPLGILQFGPILHVGYGINDTMILDAHIRFLSLGLLSYAIMVDPDFPDSVSGIAFGGGFKNFLSPSKNSPYLGGLVEYHTATALYDENYSDENATDSNLAIAAFNAGYRFQFEDGLYIDVGGFVGFGIGSWKWYYTDDPDSSSTEDGSSFVPFAMAELAFGKNF